MKAAAVFLILSFSLFLQADTRFTPPRLDGAVIDQAGFLNQGVNDQLNEALVEVFRKGGPQLEVLTVDTIGDLPIEDATRLVYKEWKLGTAKKDNGIILMIAKKERRMRIEVGQGVEGDLTDAYSRRIIDDVMVPLFRKGHFDDAIVAGVDQILKRMNPPINLEDYMHVEVRGERPRTSPLIFWIVVFLFFLFLFGRGGRGGGGSNLAWFILGNALSGGGGGGFGGGGGGGGGGRSSWSGGGGGFSGGGASGSW